MNKKIYTSIGMAVGTAAVFSMTVLPAFALVSTAAGISAGVTANNGNVGVTASLSARFQNIVTRADQEITRRINALNALDTRVEAMQKLSSNDKDSLSATIQSQLSDMASLKTQISTDASTNNTSSLKSDAQSITVSYRIFALVIPQGAIEAASDRALDTASIMADLGTKLSARISSAQASGTNVGAAQTALADFNAKVLDANTQATAAASEVAALHPDGGSATIMASNTATLKDARAKILVSQKDLVTARTDAQTIIKSLGIKISASASASATNSSQ